MPVSSMMLVNPLRSESPGGCDRLEMRRCRLKEFLVFAAAFSEIIGLGILSQTVTATTTASGIIEEVACFNTIFSVSCSPNRIIVFDSARYGRNDTHLSARCGVPFSRHCDIDVHFLMNRACAGRRKCNIMVNTALFGDPCGYEEFLRITYQCIPVSAVHNTCFSAFSPTVYNHGYLSTPNYPDKYFMDADCTWNIAVQSHQFVRITIFDFELDLKRGGNCNDFLEIASGERSYFKDCGILGKQVVEVNASNIAITFVTGQSSLTQRGFFLYFEGVGPGCPKLKSTFYGVLIAQFLDNDLVLSANVSCWDGLVFAGLEVPFLLLRCIDSSWTQEVPDCTEPDVTQPATARRLTAAPVTPRAANPSPEQGQSNKISSLSKSASVIGFALGIVSSIFFVVLLVLIVVYCYMRRKNRYSGRNIDKWRVVINNLQEHATKQEHSTYQHFAADDSISNIVRQSTHCTRRPVPNRSVVASARTSQGQRGCGVLLESSVADSTLEKRGRPTWIEIARPYSSQCTCYSTGAVTVAKCSGRHENSSSNVGEISSMLTTCPGPDCRYIGRSRQTISPCCSYWGTTKSNRSPIAEMDETDADLNSPDFVLSHSAPDLFTITRHADQLNIAEHRMEYIQDEQRSENETLLCSPDSGQWLQRDNQAMSPLSANERLPIKDSSVLISNVLRANDKRID